MRRLGLSLWGLVFIGGLVLLVFLALGLFSPVGWGRNPDGYGWGLGPWVLGGFGFPIMGLGMLVFCVFMMGSMMLHGQPSVHGAGSSLMAPYDESNLDILERRYSRGEIAKEQFEEMKRDLGL